MGLPLGPLGAHYVELDVDVGVQWHLLLAALAHCLPPQRQTYVSLSTTEETAL